MDPFFGVIVFILLMVVPSVIFFGILIKEFIELFFSKTPLPSLPTSWDIL